MHGIRHRLTRSAPNVALRSAQSLFLPLTDAGAGAVNTSAAFSGGSATPTFTRATTAWAKLASGLWASVASGTARSHYLGADTTVGNYGGYLSEQASTNLCLQARDMSNASWTKTTMTAAKDQIGIDGSANSASSLTATAGAASCLQTITQAATSATLSFFIKRITGTGTITLKQGATTSDITASVNSSTYTQVSLNASVLNPSIGIVLATNGDKIAVDMGQFENLAFATSPIPTTTVSVTRNADMLTYVSSGNVDGTIGSVYCEATQTPGNTLGRFVSGRGGSGGVLLCNQGGALALFDGTSFRSGNAFTPSATTVQKMGASWSGSVSKTFLTGAASAALGFDGNLDVSASFGIGNDVSGTGNELNGTIKNVRIWTRALADSQLVQMTR